MPPLALGLVSILGAAATLGAGNTCPSNDAVRGELDRLGALPTVENMGSVEVQVREPTLRIVLRDKEGRLLGTRDMTVTADCGERATLAAATIAAWSGSWAGTVLGEPAPAPLPPATGTDAQQPPSRRWALAAGAFGFGVHDGDRSAAGLGVAGDAAAGPLVLAAFFDGNTERERPLGPGRAGYRSVRGGVGVGVRTSGTRRLFLEATLSPVVSRVSLQGKDLETNNQVSEWNVGLSARVRAGWRTTHVTPHLFFDLSRDFLRRRATLDDRPDSLSLSATNAALGVGIAVTFAHL
jgi:hypothetical protein